MIITDYRILFLAASDDGDYGMELLYDKIASVSSNNGMTKNSISVSTTNHTYKFRTTVDYSEVEQAEEYILQKIQNSEKPVQANDVVLDGFRSPWESNSGLGDLVKGNGKDKSAEEAIEERKQKAKEEIPALDSEPLGDYVTKARYEKVKDILDGDESVHYITKGSTIDVEGSGAGESLFGNDRSRKSGTKGYVRAVATDKRVAVKIPQLLGNDERSIPYNSITSVDLDTGLVNKRISLQTKGQTYHIEVTQPGKDEVREFTRFVRKKIGEAQKPDTVIREAEEDDPLERIEKLQELHEKGAISEEEFEEKKQNLLDQV